MGIRRDGVVRTIVAAGSLCLLLIAAGASAGTPTTRPNVIVIMTDDQTLESLRVMTNVRRLIGAQGATFEDYVVSFPLCCPSRASFLTGRYSHNTGVVGNNLRNGLVRFDEADALPQWLREAGYSTIFVGKYLNAYGRLRGRTVPPGWDEWYAGTTLAYFRHAMNRNGTIVRYGTRPADYQTDVFTRTAVDAVRRHAAAPVPFFLWLSYFAPHHGGPREFDDPAGVNTPVSAPRHRRRFASEPLPQGPSFDEADLSDKPPAIAKRAPLDATTTMGLTSSYRQRLQSLLAVDEGVGRLISALRRAGALDRTLIFFTSDNGYLLGEHRLVNTKEHFYEPSIRVPLLVRGPGIPRGIRLRQPAVNVDLAPTIAEVAGATPHVPPDGRSLLPLFDDPSVEWGRDILLERGPGGNLLGARLYTGLRTPRYVYAEHATGARELYDLWLDPDQLESLHADPDYATLQDELAWRLASLRDCAGAACAEGPALTLEVLIAGGCARSVTVHGDDEWLLEHVDFVENGAPRRISEPPFTLALGSARAAASGRVRAVGQLVDGRRVTLTAPARRCA
jgi:N-acetylglucosamine-6-sulfatase